MPTMPAPGEGVYTNGGTGMYKERRWHVWVCPLYDVGNSHTDHQRCKIADHRRGIRVITSVGNIDNL
jgi:hypothetical protein